MWLASLADIHTRIGKGFIEGSKLITSYDSSTLPGADFVKQ